MNELYNMFLNKENKGTSGKKKTRRVNCFAGRKKTKTCYSNVHIEKLKRLWNARHPDKKITCKQPIKVWDKINEYLSHVCNDELCWLKNNFIDSKTRNMIEKQAFAPKSKKIWKKNPNEWLDSIDIEKVMKQYEDEYKYFKFIGPSPIDFDYRDGDMCVWDDLCKLDIKKHYDNNIRKIGMIFNLDPHYKDGSHWVSLFVDLDKNFIFYLDTNGIEIPDEINVLKNRIKKMCKDDLNKKMRFTDNAPRQHQNQNTECGMYSLYAVIKLLKEELTPQKIKRKRIPDEEMIEHRKIFFNEPL